ncbi:hypothetical protein EJD97_013147 [Solanum chilense]|uniref:DNA helicase Pif1-like 2B domain-containing protein n=1 Tax=Solanum chilense TaxID=4083 RepID=A0A6N2AM21_SOLCI|nr:hypothetical protein EJD97_013147 [Solanum chilense]
MLLRNLDPSNGLCNGKRFIYRGFYKNIIHAKITSQYATNQVFIQRIQLSPPENEGKPFKFIQNKIPIHLRFEITINKAQGQKVPNIGLYLSQHVLSHGKLYVALSRGIFMVEKKY